MSLDGKATYTVSKVKEEDEQKEITNLFSFDKKFIRLLYEKYKKNFEKYLWRHEDSMNLIINNSTQKKIKAKDYLIKRNEDVFLRSRLTPLPYLSNRKLVDENDKKEYYNVKRSIVSMRKLEYTNAFQKKPCYYTKSLNSIFKQKKLNYSGYNSTSKIQSKALKQNRAIKIQAVFRGFSLRKLYAQLSELDHQFTLFFSRIKVFKLQQIFYYLIKKFGKNKRLLKNKANDNKESCPNNKIEMGKYNKMNRDIEIEFNMREETVNVGIQVKEREISNEVNEAIDTKSKTVLNAKAKEKIIISSNSNDNDNNHNNKEYFLINQYHSQRNCIKSKLKLPYSFITKISIQRQLLKGINNINDYQQNFQSKSNQLFRQINSYNAHEIQTISKDIVPIIYNEDFLNQRTQELKEKLSPLFNKSLQKYSFIIKKSFLIPLTKIICIQRYFRSKLKVKWNKKYKGNSHVENSTNIVSRIKILFVQIVKNKIIAHSKRICFNSIKKLYYNSKVINETSQATIVDDYSQDDINFQTKKRNYVNVTEGLNLKSSKISINNKNRSLIKDIISNASLLEGHEVSDLEEIIDNYSYDEIE